MPSLIRLCRVLSLWMISCAAAGGASTTSAAEPIVLGAVFNKSGSQAELDLPSLRGAQLAVSERNQSGGVLGRPIRLVVVDGRSDPDELKQAMSECVAEHPESVAFFGLSDTDMVLAAAPVVARNGRVFLTSGATSPQLPGQVPEYLFLACFGDNVQAAAAAEWAYQNQSARTAVVLFDSTDTYTRLLHGYFETRFKDLGGEVLEVRSYTPDDIDDLAAGLPTADVVYLAAHTASDAVKSVHVLRKSGVDSPILGGDGLSAADVWRQHPDVSEVYFTDHVYLGSDSEDSRVRSFLESYEEAFPNDAPNSFAALGYDAIGLLVEAIQRARSDDPDDLRRALQTISDFEGVTGTIGYSADSRIPRKTVSIIEVAEGGLKLRERIVPEQVPSP